MLDAGTPTNRISIAQYRELVAVGAKTKPKKRKTEEEDLHRACVELAGMLCARYPILRWLHHSPNGGKRPKGEAGRCKAFSTKRGFPDLILPRRNGQWAGLAIELKSQSGRVSVDQQEWLDAFAADGYLVAVCRELDVFEDVVMRYLGGRL